MDQHLDSNVGVNRKVAFTKLLSSKIVAVVKQMQEHLVKAGITDSVEVQGGDVQHALAQR